MIPYLSLFIKLIFCPCEDTKEKTILEEEENMIRSCLCFAI